MTAIANLNSSDLARLFAHRALSPVEVAADALTRIEVAKAFNAFLPIDVERVMAEARASEKRWQAKAPLGRLDGVPATVKDNIWVRGLTTFKGSRTGDRGPAPEDAPVVARLREQGVVILGKTNMPEHGWIGACHSPLTGVTRNPWDPARTPGGSTGGGAVAALLNLGVLHLGTDGAGSLRIPASFTGVFGMKPTYGLVPVHPPSPLGALSHHGPITRTVVDTAAILSAIVAPDERDLAAAQQPAADREAGLERGVHGLRVAFCPRFSDTDRLEEDIERAVRRGVAILAEQGAEVEEARPDLAAAEAVVRLIWFATAASIVESVPEAERETMDPGFLRIAERGRAISAAQFIRAQTARGDLHRTMLAFHSRYDLLVTPTMPVAAFGVGREMPEDYGEDDWLAWSPYTYPFNLTGQPAASVPCGLNRQGLPIGLQIVAARGVDDLVLRAARVLEREQSFPVFEGKY